MEEIIGKILALGIFIFMLYIITYLLGVLDKRTVFKAEKSGRGNKPIETINVDTYTECEYAESEHANPTSKSHRYSTDLESRKLYSLIDELTIVFKIRIPINDYLIKQHFNTRNFAGCVSELKKQMGLQTVFYSDVILMKNTLVITVTDL